MTAEKFFKKPHGIATLIFAVAVLLFEGYVYFVQLRLNWVDDGTTPNWLVIVMSVFGALIIVLPKFITPAHAISDYLSNDKSGGRLAGIGFIIVMLANWSYIPFLVSPSVVPMLKLFTLMEIGCTLAFAAAIMDVGKILSKKDRGSRQNQKQGNQSEADPYSRTYYN